MPRKSLATTSIATATNTIPTVAAAMTATATTPSVADTPARNTRSRTAAAHAAAAAVAATPTRTSTRRRRGEVEASTSVIPKTPARRTPTSTKKTAGGSRRKIHAATLPRARATVAPTPTPKRRRTIGGREANNNNESEDEDIRKGKGSGNKRKRENEEDEGFSSSSSSSSSTFRFGKRSKRARYAKKTTTTLPARSRKPAMNRFSNVFPSESSAVLATATNDATLARPLGRRPSTPFITPLVSPVNTRTPTETPISNDEVPMPPSPPTIQRTSSTIVEPGSPVPTQPASPAPTEPASPAPTRPCTPVSATSSSLSRAPTEIIEYEERPPVIPWPRLSDPKDIHTLLISQGIKVHDYGVQDPIVLPPAVKARPVRMPTEVINHAEEESRRKGKGKLLVKEGEAGPSSAQATPSNTRTLETPRATPSIVPSPSRPATPPTFTATTTTRTPSSVSHQVRRGSFTTSATSTPNTGSLVRSGSSAVLVK